MRFIVGLSLLLASLTTVTYGQGKKPQPQLAPELLKELDLAEVYIRVEVIGEKRDPTKARVAKGLQKGRLFTPEAKALLAVALTSYPILTDPYSMDFEYPETCDFVGSFLAKSKSGGSWEIQFGTGNFIQIVKLQNVKGKNKALATQSGIWMSGELTIYRICELIQK